jgi:hypothetical protein
MPNLILRQQFVGVRNLWKGIHPLPSVDLDGLVLPCRGTSRAAQTACRTRACKPDQHQGLPLVVPDDNAIGSDHGPNPSTPRRRGLNVP